jgi:hypothetical protein
VPGTYLLPRLVRRTPVASVLGAVGAVAGAAAAATYLSLTRDVPATLDPTYLDAFGATEEDMRAVAGPWWRPAAASGGGAGGGS